MAEDSQTDHGELEARLRRLEQELKEVMAAEAKFAKIGSVLSLALAVIIIAFVFSICSTLADNFRSESQLNDLTASLEERWPALKPLVVEEIANISRDVLPVYKQKISEKLPGAVRHLVNELANQQDVFIENIKNDAETKMKQAMQNALATQKNYLQERFGPGMGGDLQIATEDLTERLEEHINDILRYILNTYLEDVHIIQQRLDGFRALEPEIWTEFEADKRFLHLWLMLLDQQIMKL